MRGNVGCLVTAIFAGAWLVLLLVMMNGGFGEFHFTRLSDVVDVLGSP